MGNKPAGQRLGGPYESRSASGEVHLFIENRTGLEFTRVSVVPAELEEAVPVKLGPSVSLQLGGGSALDFFAVFTSQIRHQGQRTESDVMRDVKAKGKKPPTQKKVATAIDLRDGFTEQILNICVLGGGMMGGGPTISVTFGLEEDSAASMRGAASASGSAGCCSWSVGRELLADGSFSAQVQLAKTDSVALEKRQAMLNRLQSQNSGNVESSSSSRIQAQSSEHIEGARQWWKDQQSDTDNGGAKDADAIPAPESSSNDAPGAANAEVVSSTNTGTGSPDVKRQAGVVPLIKESPAFAAPTSSGDAAQVARSTEPSKHGSAPLVREAAPAVPAGTVAAPATTVSPAAAAPLTQGFAPLVREVVPAAAPPTASSTSSAATSTVATPVVERKLSRSAQLAVQSMRAQEQRRRSDEEAAEKKRLIDEEEARLRAEEEAFREACSGGRGGAALAEQDAEFQESLLQDQLKDLHLELSTLRTTRDALRAEKEEAAQRRQRAEERLARYGENPKIRAEADAAREAQEASEGPLAEAEARLAEVEPEVAEREELLAVKLAAQFAAED